ncbi:MAG: hypothetical protein GF308_17700 [Candidatus Heimdallarchaeota archaeon]|nr:hypothetical protein [Candidatus Heimdallarchaeota archaeon]
MDNSNNLSRINNASSSDPLEISACLGFFMGTHEDVLGIGVFNMVGLDIFSSAKDLAGDVGLTAFKSLIDAVGHQIEAILPAETSVQFIAPNDVLVGVSKISSDQVLAVILKRNASISAIIPPIIEMAKLLKGISDKTNTLSLDKCLETYNRIISKSTTSSLPSSIRKIGA